VCIYEPYDIRNDMCKTNIHQRLIWQESQDEFIAAKASYRDLVENCLL
jgi:hypothetical protein